jgi:phosphopantetheine adenylyltransferase
MAEMARAAIKSSPMGKVATRKQTIAEGTKSLRAVKVADTRNLMVGRHKVRSQALVIRVVGTKAVVLAEQLRVGNV